VNIFIKVKPLCTAAMKKNRITFFPKQFGYLFEIRGFPSPDYLGYGFVMELQFTSRNNTLRGF
jgi:hypothetical protein